MKQMVKDVLIWLALAQVALVTAVEIFYHSMPMPRPIFRATILLVWLLMWAFAAIRICRDLRRRRAGSCTHFDIPSGKKCQQCGRIIRRDNLGRELSVSEQLDEMIDAPHFGARYQNVRPYPVSMAGPANTRPQWKQDPEVMPDGMLVLRSEVAALLETFGWVKLPNWEEIDYWQSAADFKNKAGHVYTTSGAIAHQADLLRGKNLTTIRFGDQ